MDDETAHSSAAFSNLSTEELRGRIMLIALSSLFIAVIFVLLLHLYAKLFWWRVEHRHHHHQYAPGSTTTRRHRHGSLVFATDQELVQATGLDLSVLKSIPVVAFKQQDFKNGLECSVCLSELIEGEKARVLPNCNHGFHVDCIDMWFQSHSTCPLCRDKIGSEDAESVTVNIGDDQNSGNGESQNSILNSGYSTESSNFPTNILVWGDQNQVSSTGAGSIETTVNPNSGNRSTGTDSIEATVNPNSGIRSLEETRLVINVPENVILNSSSSSSARFMEEDPKSPVVVSRLRSLKRLLSREKKVVTSSSSSSAPTADV